MQNIIFYSMKRLLRVKSNMFWVLAFPILLGTLFNVAFGSLSESEAFSQIPVAVVLSDDDYGKAMESTIDSIMDQDKPFLDATYATEEKAVDLLKNGDVYGVIKSGETSTLTFSASLANKEIEKSILNMFIDTYNSHTALIMDVIKNHPENIESVAKELQRETNYCKEVSIRKNDTLDTYTQYFYNLLAMACLFAAGAGVLIACENQGNLSTMAARKNISSTKKSATILGELISSTIFQFVLNLLGYFYLAFVLKVGVDVDMPYAILALFAGVFCGVSLGYLIGSIGHKDQDTKQGIVFAVTLPLCFFSGLMIGDMKIFIEQYFPVFNRINPAALISDCFYCLGIYEGHTRYFTDLISIAIVSVIFIGTGLLLTRRTQYASL